MLKTIVTDEYLRTLLVLPKCDDSIEKKRCSRYSDRNQDRKTNYPMQQNTTRDAKHEPYGKEFQIH